MRLLIFLLCCAGCCSSPVSSPYYHHNVGYHVVEIEGQEYISLDALKHVPVQAP